MREQRLPSPLSSKNKNNTLVYIYSAHTLSCIYIIPTYSLSLSCMYIILILIAAGQLEGLERS